MKVVHINTEDKKGGAAIACYRLNEALIKSGIQSQLFSIHNLSSWHHKKVWINLFLEKLFFALYQKSKKIRFKYAVPFWGIDISSYSQVASADIIHLHWVNNGFLSFNSFKQLGKLNKPIVWTLHDMGAFTGGCFHSIDCKNYQKECGNCFYMKSPAHNDLSAKLYHHKKQTYSKLKLNIVTCSKWLASKAKESSLFKELSIRAIPNPIDVTLFKRIKNSSIRSKFNIPADKFLVLFVAANVADERKGMHYLTTAINKLCDAYPKMKTEMELLIVGDVKNETFNFECKHYEAGYVNGEQEMMEYFSASTIFVTPSLDENLPNTIMEALACQTPVLAFNTGGIPDMVEHKLNGYLAKHMSAADLAEGLLWLYQNRENEELKKNALNKVHKNYTYDIVAYKYMQLYNEITK